MKRMIISFLLAGAVAILGTSPVSAADKASGSVKIGYTYIDHDGGFGVNQETYNYYEGLGLSLSDWHYGLDNGVTITGDFNNITLNNRNLRAGARKPGLFDVTFTNNQYRRIYDFDGSHFTRRNSTGFQVSVQPHRLVKVFGGYSLINKHGSSIEILSPVSDTIIASTDYSQTSINLGTLVGDRRGTLRLDYRHLSFNDKTSLNADRKADNFSATATTPVPKNEWLIVSGGYIYRKDKADLDNSALQTSQFWGATKMYLPAHLLFDYRLIYAWAKHIGPDLETDHFIHTASIGRNWRRHGGLRVGYEYRIADDFTNRTTSSGFLANGWLKPIERIYLNASIATRKDKVKEGVTLLGDEDYTRHQITARYSDTTWGDLTGQWQGRIRKNPDISSRVDYNAWSTQINLARSKLGRITVNWTYYKGTYRDQSDTLGFQFGDHVLNGTIHPRTWRNFDFDFGATYYRSRRSLNIEKSNLNFGLMYTYEKIYHVEARYHVFNYDDYLVNNSYYTANIVEVNIIKDLSF